MFTEQFISSKWLDYFGLMQEQTTLGRETLILSFHLQLYSLTTNHKKASFILTYKHFGNNKTFMKQSS